MRGSVVFLVAIVLTLVNAATITIDLINCGNSPTCDITSSGVAANINQAGNDVSFTNSGTFRQAITINLGASGKLTARAFSLNSDKGQPVSLTLGSGTGATLTGDLTVPASSTLTVSNGVSITTSNAGAANVAGTLTVSGTASFTSLAATGAVRATGGTITFSGSATLTGGSQSNAISVSAGGKVAISGALSVVAGSAVTVTGSGSSLTTSQASTFNGYFQLYSGASATFSNGLSFTASSFYDLVGTANLPVTLTVNGAPLSLAVGPQTDPIPYTTFNGNGGVSIANGIGINGAAGTTISTSTLSGAVNFVGGVTTTGSATITGATTLANSQNNLNTLTINNGATLTILPGAAIGVSGAATINGFLNATGTAGLSSATIGSTGNLLLVQPTTIGGAFTIAGSATFRAATTLTGLTSQAGSTINIPSGSSLTIQTNPANIAGTIRTTAATFTSKTSATVSGTLTNAGATVVFQNGLTSTGSITNDATSTITVTGAASLAGTVTNYGKITTNGAATISGVLTNAGQFLATSGATINNNVVNTGTFNVTGAAASVAAASTFTSNANSVVSFANGVNVAGTIKLTSAVGVFNSLSGSGAVGLTGSSVLITNSYFTAQKLTGDQTSTITTSSSTFVFTAANTALDSLAKINANGNVAFVANANAFIGTLAVSGQNNTITSTGSSVFDVYFGATVAASAVLSVVGNINFEDVLTNNGQISFSQGSVVFSNSDFTHTTTNIGVLNVGQGVGLTVKGPFMNTLGTVNAASSSAITFFSPVTSTGTLNFNSGSSVTFRQAFSSTVASVFNGNVAYASAMSFTLPVSIGAGGSLNLTGDNTFTNGATINGILSVSSGSVTFSGLTPATISGTLNLNSANAYFNFSTPASSNSVGTVNVNGQTSTIKGVVDIGSFSTSLNSVIFLDGSIAVSSVTNALGSVIVKQGSEVIFNGLNMASGQSFETHGTANITDDSVINATTVVFPGAILGLSNGVYTLGDVTVQAGATLAAAAGSSSTIYGNFQNAGVFQLGGFVVFSSARKATTIVASFSTRAGSAVNIGSGITVGLIGSSVFGGTFAISSVLNIGNNANASFASNVTTTADVNVATSAALNFGKNVYQIASGQVSLAGATITAGTIVVGTATNSTAASTANLLYGRGITTSGTTIGNVINGAVIVNANLTGLADLRINGTLTMGRNALWSVSLTTFSNTITMTGASVVNGFLSISYPENYVSGSFIILNSVSNSNSGEYPAGSYAATNPAGETVVESSATGVSVRYTANPTQPPTAPPPTSPPSTTTASSSSVLLVTMFNFLLILVSLM
eukprot:TRINITY_DN798_c0_g1_i1.p1 TRINITY_DN798_c0_g1~~TRINITY_DN798_c0_g1_i1.p1  ORF type:complete len:1309 (-),score=388.57 TRINITY_DN798_c0_g1_i1:65-3991(-)